MKNNKGFVMIETIIVMSILAVALLSLYTSYSLIIKKNQITNNDSSINTYIAYQLSNYAFKMPSNNISNPYYVEVSNTDGYYTKRDCGISSNNLICGGKTILSIEEQNLYANLYIDKVYYISKSIYDLFNNNVILLLDGSSINYLNSIKNNANISMAGEKTVIVKTKQANKSVFSYYQFDLQQNNINILRTIVGTDNSNISEPLTNPGNQNANVNEKVIGASIDDYGLSYYYRGNTDNNYLVFAGKCWRIIRITGSGDIKLILYNKDGSSCQNVNASSSYISAGAYNNQSNQNDYVSFNYNNNDSSVLQSLKNWYNANFNTKQKELLADTLWCNDKRIFAGTGAGSSDTTYIAYNRLNSSNNSKPSLSCGDSSNDLSKYTASMANGNGYLNGYKIGLITADEAVFAGLTSSSTLNSNNYLYNGSSSLRFWTMTPAYFNSSAYVWTISNEGYLEAVRVNDNNTYIRPSIALISNINTYGEGTKENPYVVIE